MRLFFIALLALYGCKEGTARKDFAAAGRLCESGRPVVSPGVGVGSFRVGASVAGVKQDCEVSADTIELGPEGVPRRIVQVDLDGHRIRAYVDSGYVSDISVTDPDLTTEDSLRGSTLIAIAVDHDVAAVEAEDELYVTSRSHCGMSFTLQYAVPYSAHHPAWTLDDLRALPPTVLVRAMNVYKCTGS